MPLVGDFRCLELVLYGIKKHLGVRMDQSAGYQDQEGGHSSALQTTEEMPYFSLMSTAECYENVKVNIAHYPWAAHTNIGLCRDIIYYITLH